MEDVEEAACLAVLDFLKAKNENEYGFFAGAALDALDAAMQVKYQEIVSQPRDLIGIRMKCKQGLYQSMDDFGADVTLCFDNAQLFCGKVKKFKHVGDAAKRLKDAFTKKFNAEAKTARKKVASGKGGGKQSGQRSSARAARQSIRGHESSLLEKVVKVIRNEPGCVLLLHPVPESAPFYSHYNMRIANPMDFDTLQANLMSTAGANGAKALSTGTSANVKANKQYDFVDEFIKDARLIFSNAIRYNCYLDKSSTALRKTVTSLLFKFETRLLDWNRKHFPADPILPPLPPLKLCLSAVEEAFQTLTTNPNAPKEPPSSAVGSFIDSVEIQLDKETLKEYQKKVKAPMDYGTIVERVISGDYRSAQDMLADVKQVTDNCSTYWQGREEEGGAIYIADAQTIEGHMGQVVNTNPQSFGPMPELPKRATMDFLDEASQPAPSLRVSLGRGRTSDVGGDGRRKSGGGGFKITLSKSRAPGSGGGSGRKKAAVVMDEDTLLPTLPAAPAAPTGPPYRASAMELANFWLPPIPQTLHESENQLHRRAVKYVVAMVGGCLEEVQKHYMKSEIVGKVMTCAPFIKPVDLRIFPAYAAFLQNEGRQEVNVQSISRNLRADKYGTSVLAVLEDMARLRDNAHAFNVGSENVEARIMADCVNNYFRYLVRRCLAVLLHSRDDGIKGKILQPALMPVLDEPTTQDVVAYLKVLDEEHRAEWEVKQVAENKKRDAMRKQMEEQAAAVAEALQREQEAYDELMQAQAGPTYEDQLDWGIDLGFDPPYPGAAAGSKGGSKGGKGGKGVQQFIHEKTGWELVATNILNKVQKHIFVDTSKPDKIIADFFHPVETMFPQIAEQYNSLIKEPIDLTIISTQLNTGTLLDAEEFYEKLSLVFMNLVTFNSREGLQEHEKFAADQMVKKGSHVADYVKWLCLEMLPLKTAEQESKSENPAMLGLLRESNLHAERKRREEILRQAPLTGSAADCKKLLATLKRNRNRSEAIAMSWFCVPPVQPSDYAVYVRRPMDLGTITKRLDKGGSNSAQGGFMTYGEFLGDLLLTFQNSIKYNAVHLADEGSATVHKAAVGFLEKLQELVPSWTIEVAEKCQREGISASHEEKLQREQFARLLEEKERMEEFSQQEMQRRLAEDEAFREDMDVEKKKQRTLEEKKAADLEKALEVPNAFERLEEEAEAVAEAEEGTEEAIAAATMVPAFLQAVSNLRLQGVGFKGLVPPYLIATAQKRDGLRKAAWRAWEPIRHHGTGHVQRDAGEDRDRASNMREREERSRSLQADDSHGPEQGSDGKRRRVALSSAETPSSARSSGGGSRVPKPLQWVRVQPREDSSEAPPVIFDLDLSAGTDKDEITQRNVIGYANLFL